MQRAAVDLLARDQARLHPRGWRAEGGTEKQVGFSCLKRPGTGKERICAPACECNRGRCGASLRSKRRVSEGFPGSETAANREAEATT